MCAKLKPGDLIESTDWTLKYFVDDRKPDLDDIMHATGTKGVVISSSSDGLAMKVLIDNTLYLTINNYWKKIG